MRIIGLDVGDKTIGVAVSDEMGWTAQGLTTIHRKDDRVDMAKIKDIIEEYGVEEIVVGLPHNLNGTLGIQAKKVITFVEGLKRVVRAPVILWDERLSTVFAEKRLLEADMSRKKRRVVRDRLAAAIILQGYLDRKALESQR
ncbi:MAG: Holliday junction resolvase RuvX [Nitrospirota bacterium]